MADIDQDFSETTGPGASDLYPMQCAALRKDGHVAIQGRPCKIVGINTSKTGEETMVHLVGKDIFTGKEYEESAPSTKNMDVPNIRTNDYQLVDLLDNGLLSLMDDNGDVKEDVKLPENDLSKEIVDKFNNGEDIVLTTTTAMGEEHVVGLKQHTI